MNIATKHDLEIYLADPATHDRALAYLQAVVDERYNYGPAGWGIVEPNGLTRLGLTAAEAGAMGAVDRAVPEPAGPMLADIVAAKAVLLQTEKCRVRDAGFIVDGIRFDSDQSARTSYLELADMLAADASYSTPWKASARAWVTMNATLYAKIKEAGAAHISTCFAWQAARDAELAAISAAVTAGTMSVCEARIAVTAVSTVCSEVAS